MIGIRLALSALAAVFIAAQAAPALAQSKATEIAITVKDNKFQPAEIEVPANTPVVIKIKNLDPKPMEFESKELRFEKIIPGGGEATITVRAQKPGRYEFYDEFHEETTRGALVVK
jgi:plastocyanin